ncbi:MAG TPA: dihydrodipicolinate synthase family protein [Opitutaceae bacterium]|jgi:N-acetylneuraminate lyase|nr:dihydrodipicolinate synthase family protein [Opitutaceae bacterium]
MKRLHLSGLIAAPYTPFDSDGRLRTELVPQLASYLVEQEVTGAFVGGTTGEWASLSTDERRGLATAWRSVAGSNLKLIVHVGHNALTDCCELARHAESIGADAIAALMPSFFRPAGVAQTVEYCRQIAAAAPRTPFYYYHIPEMTGVEILMKEFLPEAIRAIPTFAGIKFTHYNVMDFSLTLAEAGDNYDILFGRDEFLLAGLAMGAKGAVGSTYNYSARMYYKMMKDFAAGRRDQAREQQVRIQRCIVPLLKYGPLAAGKAVMGLIGLDCGGPRPPLDRVTGKVLAALKADLEEAGFFKEAGRPAGAAAAR